MYTENCVIHTFLNCHFRWYVLSLICTNVKHDKQTIRIKFKYDYKYVILLGKLRNGEDFISFLNLDTLYSGGGVNHPFRWTFSRLIYHIYIFLC